MILVLMLLWAKAAAPFLVSDGPHESFEPPLELLLADRPSPAPPTAATQFEALVARRRSLAGAFELDARRFAPALLSRRALLEAHGIYDVPVDMVDLVRLRWPAAAPSTQLVRVRLSFERGALPLFANKFIVRVLTISCIHRLHSSLGLSQVIDSFIGFLRHCTCSRLDPEVSSGLLLTAFNEDWSPRNANWEILVRVAHEQIGASDWEIFV